MKEAAWYHAGLLFPMPEAYALQGIFKQRRSRGSSSQCGGPGGGSYAVGLSRFL